jgi:hypothetical protein
MFEADREIQSVFLKGSAYCWDLIIHGDADDLQPPFAILLLPLNKARHLGKTWCTPCSPEIEHNNFPVIGRQIHVPLVQNQRNRIHSTMNYGTYTTPELKKTHTWGPHRFESLLKTKLYLTPSGKPDKRKLLCWDRALRCRKIRLRARLSASMRLPAIELPPSKPLLMCGFRVVTGAHLDRITLFGRCLQFMIGCMVPF